MRNKLWLAAIAAAVGAMVAGGAALAAGDAMRGGTLRVNVSSTDFQFVDPALAYDNLSWGLLHTTGLTLLNYPDKPAPAGSRLVPDGAAGFPRTSADGKTYTFTVKPGLRFSDGSPVSAASFAHAISRAANPRQASPAIAFLHDVVGADEFTRARRVASPVCARRARR